ncbi:MAG TPA: hypothetical protein PLC76_06540 [Saprospiraceae bacterium]|jgi:hypothetical protein|nr:hypothetical protein [Candidatus Parvibacillus calidus]MBX2937455.1 hypothetical protein [Saprospiraceae bacterium]MBX7178933.1 hypothetical protein [Saprospiraceae bacterium]MCB0589841.1 hypothetical protein [Saprospiraceae bacterium]MCC7148203.1 hypothetical protein [Saprospiraceae bacterium]
MAKTEQPDSMPAKTVQINMDDDGSAKQEKTPVSRKDRLQQFVSRAKTEIEKTANSYQPFTVEQARKLLATYASTASSTIRIILNERIADSKEENKLCFTVASNYEKENLLNEPGLLDYLRKNLNNQLITLEFEIDSSLMGDANDMKPISTEEKIKILVERNALLQDFMEKLNLKIDE